VADARARDAVRASAVPNETPRALPARAAAAAPTPTAAVMIALPGDAWCVVPAEHPARLSPAAARALAQALAAALHPDLSS
jgi:putative heme iron utilization protein